MTISYYEKIGNETHCIDKELPFKIPESWMWCRLSSASAVIMGSSPSGESICDDPSSPEFHQGKIYFSDHIITYSGQHTKEITKIAVPDSVLVMYPSACGRG